MHAITGLQKLLRRSIPSLQLKRLNTLTDIVGSALRGGRPQDPAPAYRRLLLVGLPPQKSPCGVTPALLGISQPRRSCLEARPRCRAAWVRDGLTWRFWRGSVCMN